MTGSNAHTIAQKIHPMVQAIGRDEFAKALAELPMYYSDDYKENFKPVGMEVIWQIGELPECPFYLCKAAMLQAFKLWKKGESRIEAAKEAIKQIRGSKIQ